MRLGEGHVAGPVSRARRDHPLIFSIDLAVRGQSGIEEIHIDARSGAVLKREHETR
jgi:hypothetical protein